MVSINSSVFTVKVPIFFSHRKGHHTSNLIKPVSVFNGHFKLALMDQISTRCKKLVAGRKFLVFCYTGSCATSPTVEIGAGLYNYIPDFSTCYKSVADIEDFKQMMWAH